jgi:RNA polymerase sigma-70 factor, ECF subfamily
LLADELLRLHVAAEEDFIRGLKTGDPDAYEALVRRFEMPLYRYLLAAHGDPQLAGEQSADCFGDLVEALPKMSGGAEQLRAFVFAVARNVLRRQWRRRIRERHESADLARAECSSRSANAAIEADEEYARMIGVIRSLDPATRDVMLLHYVEEMTVAEVAAATDEPIGSVKSRLHRGRKRVLEILQSESKSP